MKIPKQLPVLLLSHGAWHRPSHYQGLIEPLNARGFTVVAPELVTAGPTPAIAGKTYADDANVLLNAVSPYLDAGREVLVVAHSYGAIPGSAVVQNQTVAARKERGKRGGIVGVVYLAAFAFPETGMTIMSATGSDEAAYLNATNDYSISLTNESIPFLYSTNPPDVAEKAWRATVPQSVASAVTGAEFVAANITTIPLTYILTTVDRSFPPARQRDYATRIGATIVELETGHSPFIKGSNTTIIRQLVNTITQAAQKC